jgi:hypothetical protein
MRILVSGWESCDIMCGGRGALRLVYTCTICPRDKSSACIAAFVHPLLMDHLVDHCAVPKMELKRTAHSIKRQSESVQMFHVPQFHWHSAAVKRGRLSLNSNMIKSLIGPLARSIILCGHLCGYSNPMNKPMQITTITIKKPRMEGKNGEVL